MGLGPKERTPQNPAKAGSPPQPHPDTPKLPLVGLFPVVSGRLTRPAFFLRVGFVADGAGVSVSACGAGTTFFRVEGKAVVHSLRFPSVIGAGSRLPRGTGCRRASSHSCQYFCVEELTVLSPTKSEGFPLFPKLLIVELPLSPFHPHKLGDKE